MGKVPAVNRVLNVDCVGMMDGERGYEEEDGLACVKHDECSYWGLIRTTTVI